MGLWATKAVQCFKYCIMNHPSRSLGNRSTNGFLHYQEHTQEVSEKNFSMLPRDHSHDILMKKVAAFCPYPKSLPKAKVESFGLTLLAEEMSKQPNRDSVM